MSGVDIGTMQYRKGAAETVSDYVGWQFLGEVGNKIDEISKQGGTPLVVAAKDMADPSIKPKVYGVIYLKDIVKGGLVDRFARFRAMGIRTVMITGDNPLTARRKQASMISSPRPSRRTSSRSSARNRPRAGSSP
jgi:K+-transporting ATPase ATPase B chain